MLGILISLVVTTVSLLIISRLPVIGVEIDSFGKALLSAVVFGVINAVLHVLTAPLNFITFGIFSFIVNAIAFGLAAMFVQGFRLQNKIVSPLLGSIVLSILNSIIFKIFASVGLPT